MSKTDDRRSDLLAPANCSATGCRKCGKPRQWYGIVGGYSAQCEACNLDQGRKRRAASARRRSQSDSSSSTAERGAARAEAGRKGGGE